MKKQNNAKKEAPKHEHVHCDHVYKRCCECGRWVNKGGHGQFLGISGNTPIGGEPTSPLSTGVGEAKDATELKQRNLANRTMEQVSGVRPADDSVSQAIGRLTKV